MNIGQVSAALFLGIADIPWIGRRGLNFFGNAFVAFACIFCAFSTGIPMFMAGRFLMGFGTALMSSSTYMAEIAPVHLRGRMVGIFGACFQVGSLFMSGALIGLQKLPGNWGWRAPLLMQAAFPLFVVSILMHIDYEDQVSLIMNTVYYHLPLDTRDASPSRSYRQA
jgi:MFS family permease